MNLKLSPTFFLEAPVDFEHKQYVLLAFLQKAEADFKADKLDPYHFEIKRCIQNLESFITTRKLVDPLTEEQEKLLEYINSIPDNTPDMKEVTKITKWSLKKLLEIQKKSVLKWSKVESSLNLYYLGEKPFEVKKGFLFIKYGGSIIIEVYKFKLRADGKIDIKHYEYANDENITDLKERIDSEAQPDERIYVVAESLIAFNTKNTVLPVIKSILDAKVITKGNSKNLLK